MVLWRYDVGSRRKGRGVEFDVFPLKIRYETLGSCRGRLRQAYYRHKAEAEALVLLERGTKC